jgi:RimJ/RimL family protein N-acetyltransferase
MRSALHPDYPLRTDRLVLRPFEPDDAEAIAAYQGRADVCRYIPYSPRSVAEVRQRLDGGAWRLGMRQEAHLRENEWFKGEWTDEIVFAQLAQEWRAQATG